MHGNSNANHGVARASRWAMWALGAGALFYLLTEHRAHLFGWLPFLILLSCPLMHIFMHHGHHHRSARPDQSDKGGDSDPQSAHKHY